MDPDPDPGYTTYTTNFEEKKLKIIFDKKISWKKYTQPFFHKYKNKMLPKEIFTDQLPYSFDAHFLYSLFLY